MPGGVTGDDVVAYRELERGAGVFVRSGSSAIEPKAYPALCARMQG